MNNDLISRQSVLDAITASINQYGGRYTTEQLNMWGLFTQMIKEIPPAEPEPSQVARDIARIVENEQDMRVIAHPEIIRCKDCKHYKYGMCMKICVNKSTNGFCDWGERRTE